MPRHRHVLGLSGGRDSAALAVYMRQHHPELVLEYFFTDTGKELPEVYDYLGRLEGFLGQPIVRLNPDRDFDFWLKQYNNFLPSPQTRWCTRQLKIRPFEQWLKQDLADGVQVHSYVAIRADEMERGGMIPTQPNLTVHLPFVDQGIDKAGVVELLTASGLGLPAYYRWRSRSGCTFCFYQRKLEWVRLHDEHPEAFEEARRYEKIALENQSPFTWSQGESLDELIRPERVAQIQADHEKRMARAQRVTAANPLQPEAESIDLDDIYGGSKACLVCHK